MASCSLIANFVRCDIAAKFIDESSSFMNLVQTTLYPATKKINSFDTLYKQERYLLPLNPIHPLEEIYFQTMKLLGKQTTNSFELQDCNHPIALDVVLEKCKKIL
jgi:hypothetical protein